MKNMYKGTLKGCLRNVVVYIPAKNYKELIEKMDGRGFKLSEMKVSKENRQKLLISVIQKYLEDLQNGRLGTPTLNDLQSAGILHRFLEEQDKNIEEN